MSGLKRIAGIRRVENHDYGWIARDQCGGSIGGDDWRWSSRDVARSVAVEADMFGPFPLATSRSQHEGASS